MRRPLTSATISRRSPLPPGPASAVVSAGAYGSRRLSNSVSIHLVWTRKSPSAATNAGSRTTARSNGSTVGTPSTTISSSARRARSSASARSAPVTINLASIESKAPDTTDPATTPASSRTPGPVGGTNAVTVPGAGRNERPGSSALIRNSMLCPRAGRSVLQRSFSPAAIRNCSRTRSTPVVSSVTGCSTCSRVLTSRNDTDPSAPTRNSTVPAPRYPAAAQIARAAS